MRNLILNNSFLTLMFCVASWQACNNMESSDESKNAAEEHNEAKFDQSAEKDAEFLVDVADLNLTEIQISEVAVKNAQMDETRRLAEMIIADHQKAQDELTALASRKVITLPVQISESGQHDVRGLMEDKPEDVDKNYCDKMVEGHKKAIDKFETAAKETADEDIRHWAENMLPALRKHLDHAMECQKQVNEMKASK